jgi:hypothetical protein
MAVATSTVLLGLAIGSMGAQGYSKWKQGSAAKEAGEAGARAAESQAQLADFNAQVAELQAADAVARGDEEEQRFRTGVRTALGAQIAGFAAQNVDVGFGSAVDVYADAAFLGELDAQAIRNNAMREAWGFEVEAEDYRRRAKITREEGVMMEEAGRREQSASRFSAVAGVALEGASLYAQRYGFGGSSTKVAPKVSSTKIGRVK